MHLDEEYYNKELTISYSRNFIKPITNFTNIFLPTSKKEGSKTSYEDQNKKLNYFLLINSLIKLIKNENEIINYQEINDVIKYCSHSREEILSWFLIKKYLPKI